MGKFKFEERVPGLQTLVDSSQNLVLQEDEHHSRCSPSFSLVNVKVPVFSSFSRSEFCRSYWSKLARY